MFLALTRLTYITTLLVGLFITLLARADGTFVIADKTGDYGMLAPYAHHRNGLAYLYTSYVFDSLIGQDRKGNPVPQIAQSWSVSSNGTQWDFHIDPQARWHDNTPLTAADVAFTFRYMTKHPYLFASVKNVVQAIVLSDNKVRIVLAEPDSGFMFGTLTGLPILPMHIYSGQDAPERFLDADAAVGSGPYKLVTFDRAQGRYLLERNKHYHVSRPKFENIMIVRMQADAAIQGMRRGEVDAIAYVPADREPSINRAGAKFATYLSNHPVRLMFNHRGMFADKTLRHALAYAIDRQALVDIAHHGMASVAQTGYFQASSPWRTEQSEPTYPFNPTKAAQLLTTVGWERDNDGAWSKDGQKAVITLLSSPSTRKLSMVLADQLKRFGLTIDLAVVDRSLLLNRITKGRFELAVSASATMGDPTNIRRRVLGNSPSSDRYPDDDGELEALLKAQAKATNIKERAQILAHFQIRYAEELPAYMLVNPTWAAAYNHKIEPPYALPDGVAIGIPAMLHKYILLD